MTITTVITRELNQDVARTSCATVSPRVQRRSARAFPWSGTLQVTRRGDRTYGKDLTEQGRAAMIGADAFEWLTRADCGVASSNHARLGGKEK